MSTFFRELEQNGITRRWIQNKCERWIEEQVAKRNEAKIKEKKRRKKKLKRKKSHTYSVIIA